MKRGPKGSTTLVKCGQGHHEVFFGHGGEVIFHQHRHVDMAAMVSECQMQIDNGDIVGSCFLIAAALVGRPINTAVLDTWLWKQLEALDKKRKERRFRQEQPAPFEMTPRQEQVQSPHHFLFYEASTLLHLARFRTSKISHRTLVTLGSYTSVNSKHETAPGTEVMKGKKLFAKKRQVVELTLNLPEWASVHIRGAGLVQRHFVTRIVRKKSKNELYVKVLKQSTGFVVKEVTALIHQDTEGVWRINEWL